MLGVQIKGPEEISEHSKREGKEIILVESTQTLDEKALVVNITCLHLRKQRLKVFSVRTPRVNTTIFIILCVCVKQFL